MADHLKNFFIADNRIFEYGLKPRDIAVYCFLCRRLNRKTNVAFPSRRDIANGCGIKKEETVDKALKVLVEKGADREVSPIHCRRRLRLQRVSAENVTGWCLK